LLISESDCAGEPNAAKAVYNNTQQAPHTCRLHSHNGKTLEQQWNITPTRKGQKAALRGFIPIDVEHGVKFAGDFMHAGDVYSDGKTIKDLTKRLKNVEIKEQQAVLRSEHFKFVEDCRFHFETVMKGAGDQPQLAFSLGEQVEIHS
jgi:hypothetical protein